MLMTEREQLRHDIQACIKKHGAGRPALMPILQEIQARYGHVSEEAMQDISDALNIRPVEVYSTLSFYTFFSTEKKGRYVVRLCRTISCDMLHKDRVERQLENELGIRFGETSKDGLFTLEYTNCLGMCDQGPALLVNDKLYTKVTPERVHEIVQSLKRNFGPLLPDTAEIRQNLLKTGPLTAEAGCTAHDGLRKALEMNRAEVLHQIRESGLKGRGGAGFGTAMKWQFAAAAKGDKKYVVCNADEGEPGTFKDRLLLLNAPELLFDGMAIAGHVLGAHQGFIYLRGEYAYLKKPLEDALARARKEGALGNEVLGRGFAFDIEVRMGAGAYVCGEETALIESLEGKRGEPRNRPPFPVNTGYDGCPTTVNNVETFVDAALILQKGADWFAALGTEKSRGAKLFSISGDCARPGIYELPFGVSIEEMLKEVGGEDAKAVQVGGASGLCVPRRDFGRKIAFEDVASGGSIIVFGPGRDMLAVAENFMEFFAEESCGQCFPCRKGTAKLLEGVKTLLAGKCSIAYLKELEALGRSMQTASKCGLGQSAPNAFLAIVENFADEILGRAPAAH